MMSTTTTSLKVSSSLPLSSCLLRHVLRVLTTTVALLLLCGWPTTITTTHAFVMIRPRSHSLSMGGGNKKPTSTSSTTTKPNIASSNLLLLSSLPPTLPSRTFATASSTTALQLSPTDAAAAAAAAAASSVTSDTNSYLWQYFWETVIANGVPAGFALLVIFMGAAIVFRPASSNVKALQESIFGQENPAFALYQNLYGDQLESSSSKKKRTNLLARLFRGGSGSSRNDPDRNKIPLNIGIPAQQYLTVTHLNQKFDSYAYSLTAATQNSAVAAAAYRKASLARILDNIPAAAMSTTSSSNSTLSSVKIPLSTWQIVQQQERDLLQQASRLLADLQAEQTLLAAAVMDQEMQHMGLTESPYQLDPPPAPNSTTTTAATAATTTMMKVGNKNKSPKKQQQKQQPNTSQILQSIAALQKEIQELELDFIKCILAAVGPDHAATVRTALLGNLAVRGTGSLLRDLQDRPLNLVLSSSSSVATNATTTTTTADAASASATDTPPTSNNNNNIQKKKLFVTRFPGDATASQVATLREEVTAICQNAQAGVDEALVVLQTGGGTVTGYGLAAAQLLRFKQEAGLKLTIAVEQVAASGGYMMCCVADHIVASPFAVLGSIGVITDIPNVYERLKEEGIEFQTVTAGKYKRTLTPTKKVTKADFEKTKEDVEDILRLFRDFVAENRPQLDIDSVATGETWFGTAALERKLCDEIKTVDAVLMNHVQNGYDVYEVKYTPPVETPFGKFVPATNSNTDDDANGLIGTAIRWLVRTLASEIKSELAASDFSNIANKPVQERYMMIDDSADRIKAQD